MMEGQFNKVYLAHSNNAAAEPDPLKVHLELVAERASRYADAFGAATEARLAGLLHDLGKYGDQFQKRLRGEAKHVDHWSIGAWIALMNYRVKGIASALSIQGHHIGLQKASKDALGNLNPMKFNDNHPSDVYLSDTDTDKLLKRMARDGLALPDPDKVKSSLYDHSSELKAAGMLDIRMLFSAVVDADFIETEAHFNATRKGVRAYRQEGSVLDSSLLLSHLLSYIDKLARDSTAAPAVRKMRSDLLDACLSAADSKGGLFTLTAPTGTGKTLSMLAFALRHAACNGLRRIITVIPYLSIIEQTAAEYRKAFATMADELALSKLVLEHHSLSGTRTYGRKGKALKEYEQETDDQERLLAENWDAPIIVTTSVQFLESLFSNRPSSCRKLHRIANSVVLFDEVQTLPLSLAIPTIATLSHLSSRYNTTVVFSTATQPAFKHLDAHVRKYCSCGWNPTEIVPANLRLYERARRNRFRWPSDSLPAISWKSLAEEMASDSNGQVLCIVNLKKHAMALYHELAQLGAEGIYHLSTNMCPAHRQAVLNEVRTRLGMGMPCRLVSTQCVEAGVDIDFPCVYRAIGPLDSIAQAAGRCNRNGLLESGEVTLFIPEVKDQDKIYPDGAYGQAAGVTQILLAKYRSQGLDMNSPAVFEEYYRELYDISRPEERKRELTDAIDLRDFEKVASTYRLIDNNTINILVPYEIGHYTDLADEVRYNGLTSKWMTNARPFTVSLFKPQTSKGRIVFSYIEPVPIGRGSYSEEWFIYLFAEHYSKETGLNPPDGMECFIA